MPKLFANSEDPDQTPDFAASDLGLHCVSITLLGVSRLQWVHQILCNSFASNWQLPFLNQQKGENDPTNYFTIDFPPQKLPYST